MKMVKKIPLLRPLLPNTDALVPYLREIDKNQWYTNFGPMVQKLERKLLSEFSQGKDTNLYLTTVSNCTVGLELALSALALPASSRVLVPGLTFVATATAVLRSGHQLLLADIDPDSWLLTPDAARNALEKYPFSAVMPVATFGCPQDTDEWDRFTKDTGIPVVIDAAGAYGNQGAARLATVVFSSHATKTMSSAEGGVIVSGNKMLVESIRQMSNFGIDLSVATPISQGVVNRIGTNAKMSEYHAAIALAALDQWSQTCSQRLGLSVEYENRLDKMGGYLVRQKSQNRLVNSLMPIRLKAGINLPEIITRMMDKGIETRRWYCPPIHQHPAFASAIKADELVEVESLSESLLGLPFFLGMEVEEVDYVCASLAEALEN